MGGRVNILSFLVLAVLALGPFSARAQTWAIQFVDRGSAGASTSLGLVQGFPVISYFGSPRNLKYASLNPQTKAWNLLRVDAGGEFTSLDVDPNGIVHVSYVDAVALDVKYWRNNQGVASIQVIDSETGQGGMSFVTSLRVDGQGTPHVSYYYYRSPDGSISADRLKYADPSGSSWVPVFADPTPGRGRYNSLALDGSGNPWIAYYDRLSRALRLATRVTGTIWASQGVDSTGDPGWFNSIALSALGFPRISYIGATPTAQLRFASLANDGVTWTTQNVGPVGAVTSYSATSLRLDSGGNPHISYYDASTGALKYASRSGGNWSSQTVDSVGDVGGYSSLVLDSSDRPIISYFDATNQALKIAYGPGYSDGDNDGIPDTFDACPTNPDCNQNGIIDGREGGSEAQSARLPDESIFGCGSVSGIPGPPGGNAPPFDLLFLLAPAAYLLRGKVCRAAAFLARSRT